VSDKRPDFFAADDYTETKGLSGRIRQPLASRLERFIAKIDTISGPVHPRLGRCWNWLGGIQDKGYGSFKPGADDKSVLAHREAYMSAIGPIPGHLEIDHLCRNRVCVRPSHLEAVTHAENLRRREPQAQPSMCSVCRVIGHTSRSHGTPRGRARLAAMGLTP
jgi:hypothetical protein